MIGAGAFAVAALLVGAYLILRAPTYLGATLYAILVVCILGVGLAALGRPAPLWAVRWALPEEPTVLGFALKEGVEIDVILEGTPNLFVALPWSEPQAAQLSEAAAKATHLGRQVKMGQPAGMAGSNTQDDEKPMFYPAPPAPNPPKEGE